jgi:XTP/dITP diphosphohydrolase
LRKDRPEIHFATSNRNKFLEATSVMEEYGIRLAFLGSRGVEIQSDNLEEIAKQSAIASSTNARTAVVAEDAGLFVDALRGFPGAYSSFTFRTLGCEGILKLMEGISDRKARFVSAVAYCEPNMEPICFSGTSEGVLGAEARGDGGFGFDPIFTPTEVGTKAFAEMSQIEKNTYSHRARAFRRFAEWFVGSKP